MSGILRIGLVGCALLKLERPAPARDLYSPSALFRWSLAYALKHCDHAFVLSAKYGLVPLDREIEPYNQKLAPGEAAAWAVNVLAALDRELPGRRLELVILAGDTYVAPIRERTSHLVVDPLRGIAGVPARVKWLQAALADAATEGAAT